MENSLSRWLSCSIQAAFGYWNVPSYMTSPVPASVCLKLIVLVLGEEKTHEELGWKQSLRGRSIARTSCCNKLLDMKLGAFQLNWIYCYSFWSWISLRINIQTPQNLRRKLFQLLHLRNSAKILKASSSLALMQKDDGNILWMSLKYPVNECFLNLILGTYSSCQKRKSWQSM